MQTRPLALRLALPAALATLVVLAVVAAYPACRAHPGGSDPLLWRYWMDGISENQPLATLIDEGGIGALFVFLGVAPVALIVGCIVARRQALAAWLPLLVAVVVALAVTLLHIRGQAMLSGLAAALAAALLAHAAAKPGWTRIAACATLVPIGWLVVGALLMRPASGVLADRQAACRSPELLAALSRLPPATLVVPMMAEPHLLAKTRHRSLAATYHRNQAGNRAMIAAMIAAPAQGTALLADVGVGYVVYCPGYDTDRYARMQSASLAAAVVARRSVAGLVPIASLTGGVTIYRVALGNREAAR